MDHHLPTPNIKHTPFHRMSNRDIVWVFNIKGRVLRHLTIGGASYWDCSGLTLGDIFSVEVSYPKSALNPELPNNLSAWWMEEILHRPVYLS